GARRSDPTWRCLVESTREQDQTRRSRAPRRWLLRTFRICGGRLAAATSGSRLNGRYIGVLLLGVAVSGCWAPEWARMRSVPQNPLAQPLDLLSRKGPRPTPSTMQLLRRHA